MIYTVTLNPSLDYVMHADSVQAGRVNRTRREELFFGGKGLNVSYILKELGVPSLALGFTAGFTGAEIRRLVKEAGIDARLIELGEGKSRINVKLKAREETEFNASGPYITEEKLLELYEKLDGLSEGDFLVLAGSIPACLPRTVYEDILKRLSGKKINTVVDASGRLLLEALRLKPFLIKPNDRELSEIFSVDISDKETAARYALKLKEAGALNVLVSMAEKGAVLVDENGDIHTSEAFKGSVKNSVGAGDSMVAGFIAGYLRGGYEEALKLGTAAGGATAFSDSLADRESIMRLYNGS